MHSSIAPERAEDPVAATADPQAAAVPGQASIENSFQAKGAHA